MKGYKRFAILIVVLLALYVVAEMNRPEQVDWSPTLSSVEKNPYGAYILFQQLKDLFPAAAINTYHLPVYNQLSNSSDFNTAYLLLEPSKLNLLPEDVTELLNYTSRGNYVFIAAPNITEQLMDTLKLATDSRFKLKGKGPASINFLNPTLRSRRDYSYRRMTLDRYFSSFDTASTVALGNSQDKDVNFIKVVYGKGAFFVHAIPLCFTNDFMLTGPNADYSSKALSYLPENIHTIYWDEYYKQPDSKNQTPLRYFLGNKWLAFALRLALFTMLLFVVFEMKRKQKIIPVIAPLRNSTLDFVRTVGNVYFNNRDNKNIALKKVNYFLETVRSGFNLSTQLLDDNFSDALAKKAGVPGEDVAKLIEVIARVQHEPGVSDQLLLELNRRIENFNSITVKQGGSDHS